MKNMFEFDIQWQSKEIHRDRCPISPHPVAPAIGSPPQANDAVILKMPSYKMSMQSEMKPHMSGLH